MRWDLFISHASEDKQPIAEPLYRALTAAGLNVWFDQTELLLGDRLLAKVNEGLAHSRYGIVIFSPAFFGKKWPEEELAGLFALEELGQPKILPVWHQVTRKDVVAYSPIIAGRLAVETAKGIDHVVSEIRKRFRTGETPQTALRPARVNGNAALATMRLNLICDESTKARNWRVAIVANDPSVILSKVSVETTRFEPSHALPDSDEIRKHLVNFRRVPLMWTDARGNHPSPKVDGKRGLPVTFDFIKHIKR